MFAHKKSKNYVGNTEVALMICKAAFSEVGMILETESIIIMVKSFFTDFSFL